MLSIQKARSEINIIEKYFSIGVALVACLCSPRFAMSAPGETTGALTRDEFLTAKGYINKVLLCGTFPFEDVQEALALKCPDLDPKEGQEVAEHLWAMFRNPDDADGLFAFPGIKKVLQGPTENAYVLMSFWVKIPDKYHDADVPLERLDLKLSCSFDDYVTIWINGQQAVQSKAGAFPDAPINLPLSSMRVGWNNILIQCIQLGGAWYVRGKITATDPAFLDTLQYALEKPE
jgi:hypothetical protein